MKILRIPASLLLILPILGMWGCKNNSTSPNAPSTNATPAIPPLGSTFVMDGNNGGSLTSETYTVETTTKKHLANSQVFKLFGVQKNGFIDSSYIAFESDGDYSINFTSWNESAWSTLPFASHSTINTTSDQGSGDTIYGIAQYSGAGALFLLNGTQYSTDSVTVREVNTDMGDTSAVLLEHYSFIPQLGLMAYDRIDSTTYSPGSVDSLVQYTPKK